MGYSSGSGCPLPRRAKHTIANAIATPAVAPNGGHSCFCHLIKNNLTSFYNICLEYSFKNKVS